MKCCILDFFVVLKQKSKTTEMAPCLLEKSANVCWRFFMYLCSNVATLSQVISNVSTQELVCRLTHLNLIS